MRELTLRLLSVITVLIFSVILFASCYAVDTSFKVGKYGVGINYSPLSACAAWYDGASLKYRAVNSSEYLKISSDHISMDIDNLIPALEKIAPTRPLTSQENAFCGEVAKIIVTVLKAVPSKSGTRKTRDITATDYTDIRIPDSSLCEGPVIKKYRTNQNWHKVKDKNLTTLCGLY